MVKDRVPQDIGAKEPLQDWNSINWKQVKKRVRNLRQRIYRATQQGQWNKVRSLMKLMLRSYANLLDSVRRVTLDNKGKRTAGVDNVKVTTPQERVKLINKWKEYQLWKTNPVKRIYIPKSNGKRRPLGIPTIQDRVAQSIVKNSLEPCWEAQFEANSYGFRPGRSCHDALQQCWTRLQKGNDTWVLDADIKGAFDNISHDYILKSIGTLPGRELIKQWLKVGYVEAGCLHDTDSGTPQGGMISPLLANIALHGLEELLSTFKREHRYEVKTGKTAGAKLVKQRPKSGYIRYADDFIITAKSSEDILSIFPHVQEWLKQRGLTLNEEKTKIRHIKEGFNFLGFNIRHFDGKCLLKPQKEKVIAKLREIKEWLETNRHTAPSVVIRHLNEVVLGLANYYKHGVSHKTFEYIDYRMYEMLYKWAVKRHPKKLKGWVKRKYFGKVGNDSWVFRTLVTDRHGKQRTAQIYKTRTIPITRHIKVKGTASPDDPSLKDYWAKRKTHYGKEYFSKASQLYQIAEQQNWFCPICGEHLCNGESIDTHHIVPVSKGGNDDVTNRVHLHKACHKQVHGKGLNVELAGA